MIAGIMKLLPLLNKAIDLVPDKNKITANDPEDLGSCITGEWKDNNKNMEK